MALTPKRHYHKLLAAVKDEVDYAVDSVPTGAANAIEMSNVTFTPLAGNEVERQYIRPYFGHQGSELVGQYNRVQFTVDFAGSGTAGVAPAWGPLLRATGWAETTVEDTSVIYERASDGNGSAVMYLNLDGVNHAMLGVRGKSSAALTSLSPSTLTFEMTGLLGPITDVPLPAAVYTAWKRGLVVTKANTPLCTLFGTPLIAQSLTLDFGQVVTTRHRIYEEGVHITDAKVTGSLQFEAKTQAAGGDWFARASASPKPRGALAFQHGPTAGNIIEITAGGVEVGAPSYTNSDGMWDYTVPFVAVPTDGDDEITITLR